MKAIIETGGKQYTVTEGDTIYVEKLDVEEGKTVKFTNVLMLGDVIGHPYVEGAVNNFLDSLDKPEEHITKTALDEDSKEKLNTVNDVSHNDMLDEFEKEYQAFIEKLKQQRAEKLR